MDLKDRKILITGANGGLGRAMAAAMAEHGAMLALCEQTHTLAEAAKAALPEPARAQAHAFAADLTDPDAVAAMVSDSALPSFVLSMSRMASQDASDASAKARTIACLVASGTDGSFR